MILPRQFIADPDIVEIVGSAYWASYLVNGDSSGMEPAEIAACNSWLAQANGLTFLTCSDEEPWFSWSYGLHTGTDTSGGECLTYLFRKPAMGAAS